MSREEAAQQRGKKLLQAVAGIRPGSEATASWGVIRHQKGPRGSQAVHSTKEMPAPERRRGDDDVSPAPDRSAMHKRTHPAPERMRKSGRIHARGNREARSEATEGTLSEMRTESKTPIFCGQAEFVSASRDPQDVRRRML